MCDNIERTHRIPALLCCRSKLRNMQQALILFPTSYLTPPPLSHFSGKPLVYCNDTQNPVNRIKPCEREYCTCDPIQKQKTGYICGHFFCRLLQ